jgi:hypothetical protein
MKDINISVKAKVKVEIGETFPTTENISFLIPT